MTESLVFRSITEMAAALRSGEIGAEQLLRQYAERIDRLADSSFEPPVVTIPCTSNRSLQA